MSLLLLMLQILTCSPSHRHHTNSEHAAPFEAALGILSCLLLSNLVLQQSAGLLSVTPAVALV